MFRVYTLALLLLAPVARAATVPITVSDPSVVLKFYPPICNGCTADPLVSASQTFELSGTLDTSSLTYTVASGNFSAPTDPFVWTSAPFAVTKTYDPPGFDFSETQYPDAVVEMRLDLGPGFALPALEGIVVPLDPLFLKGAHVFYSSNRILGSLTMSASFLDQPATVPVWGTPLMVLQCAAGPTCSVELGLGSVDQLPYVGTLSGPSTWVYGPGGEQVSLQFPAYTQINGTSMTGWTGRVRDAEIDTNNLLATIPEPSAAGLLLGALALLGARAHVYRMGRADDAQ